MAMEYLPDGSMQQKLRELVLEDKVLTEEQVLRLIRPVADALGCPDRTMDRRSL